MKPGARRSFLLLAGVALGAGCLLGSASGCSKPGSSGATAGSGASGTGGQAAGSAGPGGAGSSSGPGGPDGGVLEGGPDPLFGTDGHGKGDIAQAPCDGVVNALGPVLDMAWPNPSNIGHDGPEGSSIHFHWSGGPHNVVQITSWLDYWHPSPSMMDPAFPRGFKSGAKADSGDLYLDFGAFGCGYRPGIYYFVDENNPAGGIVSASMTVTPDPVTQTAAYYAPQPCSALADKTVYGGRYWAYATRKGCTVFEVNNFQTLAHYDWLPDVFHAQQPKQGDLVLFRWTGFHSVVQVHDYLQDKPIPGGITSGAKKECVGGPNYSCANAPPTDGEYLIDTEDYRPGILHFSDEDAIFNPTTKQCWNPICSGTNQEFQLAYRQPAEQVKCCDLPGASGKYSSKCRVVEVYNDASGAQWNPYNIGAGGNDVVRFRWAGTIKLYQVKPNTMTPKPGGFGMLAPVECVPGPHMTCLNGTTDQAMFLFDLGAGHVAMNYELDMFNNISWPMYAEGEVTEGFTSNNSGAIVFPTSAYDPGDPKCP